MSIISLPTIDLRDALNNDQPPLDFVFPNFLAGTVGAIVAPGGAGKSMFSLQLAIQIAAQIAGGGRDLLDLGFGDVPGGQVTYMAAEDPVPAIKLRLRAMGKRLDRETNESIAQSLAINPLIGKVPDICDGDWFDTIRDAAEGRRLMILDTLRRFHQLEENSSGDAAVVLGRLEKIATDSGCAVLFLHHAGKSAVLNGGGDTAQASRGSSGWVDNGRYAGYLSSMSTDEAKKYGVDESRRGYYVRFGTSKPNYGEPLEPVWLRRGEGGVLLPVELTASQTKAAKSSRKYKDWMHEDGRAGSVTTKGGCDDDIPENW